MENLLTRLRCYHMTIFPNEKEREEGRKRVHVIKSVISDLGNVILFFDNDIFFKKITQHSPLSLGRIKELAKAHFSLVEDFDRGTITPRRFYEEVAKRLQAKMSFQTFDEFYCDVFSLNPPVLKTLRQLMPSHRLILLSNTDVLRFGFIRKRFPEIFIFDAYVLSYEVGTMKPHPQIYNVALKEAQAKPEECILIDDREENIEAATKLGIETIHFTLQTELKEALGTYGLSFS